MGDINRTDSSPAYRDQSTGRMPFGPRGIESRDSCPVTSAMTVADRPGGTI